MFLISIDLGCKVRSAGIILLTLGCLTLSSQPGLSEQEAGSTPLQTLQKNDFGVLVTGGHSNTFLVWRRFYNPTQLFKVHSEIGAGYGRSTRSGNSSFQLKSAMGTGIGSRSHFYLQAGLFHYVNVNPTFSSVADAENQYPSCIEMPGSGTVPYDFDSFLIFGFRQTVFKRFYFDASVGYEWFKVIYPCSGSYFTFNIQLGYNYQKK